jgi:hypothetical protein
MFILSIAALVFLALIVIKYPKTSWMYLPIFFAFLAQLAIFQQSLSVHVQGYSYVYGSIFAIAMANGLTLINERFKSLTYRLPLYLSSIAIYNTIWNSSLLASKYMIIRQ